VGQGDERDCVGTGTLGGAGDSTLSRIGCRAAADLHDAMFQALGQNPSYVLRRAETEYPLADLCRGRSDPLQTYNDAIAEQERTIAAVKTVKSEGLESKREVCLSKLEQAHGVRS